MKYCPPQKVLSNSKRYYLTATENVIHFRMVVKQLINKIILFGFTNVEKNIFIRRDCQVKCELPSKTLVSFAKEGRINKIFAVGTRSVCSDRILNMCWLSGEISTSCH